MIQPTAAVRVVAALLLLPAFASVTAAPASGDALPSASTPSEDALATARGALLEQLNAERQRLGLAPVRLVPALSAAAQAHVADMQAKSYFGLTSPDGKAVKSWVEEAGYRPCLLVEKLAKTGAGPAALIAAWAREPEKHAQSLFHPELRDLGLGAGAGGDGTTYALVLARAAADPLADPSGARDELFARLNQLRAAQKKQPLARDHGLDRTAQAVAEQLRAQLAGAPQAHPRRPAPRTLARGPRFVGGQMVLASIAEVSVIDSLSAEDALDRLLAAEESAKALLDTRYFDAGVGVAVAEGPDGPRVVWVQYLGRVHGIDPLREGPLAYRDGVPPWQIGMPKVLLPPPPP
jgi:uncharacterized protein YkwD